MQKYEGTRHFLSCYQTVIGSVKVTNRIILSMMKNLVQYQGLAQRVKGVVHPPLISILL